MLFSYQELSSYLTICLQEQLVQVPLTYPWNILHNVLVSDTLVSVLLYHSLKKIRLCQVFFSICKLYTRVPQIENASRKGIIKLWETKRESDFLSRTESRYTLQ